MSRSELFKNLTDDQIDKIYLRLLPDPATISDIEKILKKIRRIVYKWDKEAEVRPYGSLTNGFLLK